MRKPKLLCDSYILKLSPEVHDFLNPEKTDFVCVKTRKGHISLLKPKINRTVERNCVEGHFSEKIWLKLCPEKALVTLTRVELALTNEENMDSVSEWISREEKIPVHQGQMLMINGIELKVQDTRPTFQGLWGPETETYLSVDAPNQTTSLAANYAPVIRYALGLQKDISPLLHECYINWKTHLHTWTWQQVPGDLFKHLSLESCNLSATVLLNLGNRRERQAGYVSIQSLCSESAQFVPACFSNQLEPGVIYATASFMENFGALPQQDKMRVEMADCAPKDLAHLELVPFNTSLYRDLSRNEVDALLTAYFSTPKVLFDREDQLVQMDMTSMMGPYTEHLMWELPKGSFDSLYFLAKCVLPSNGGLVRACSAFSSLKISEEPKKARKPSESCLVTESMAWGHKLEAMANLPPFLANTCLQVMDIVDLESHEGVKMINFLFFGKPGSGKHGLIEALGKRIGLDVRRYDARSIQSDTSGATEAKLRQLFDQTLNNEVPCILLILNIRMLARTRDGDKDHRVLHCLEECMLHSQSRQHQCIIIGDAEINSSLDASLASIFNHHIHLPELDNSSNLRRSTLDWILRSENLTFHGDVESVAHKTSGFTYTDLKALVQEAFAKAQEEPARLEKDKEVYLMTKIEQTHMDLALPVVQSLLGDSVGAPKIPQVKWEDVGGLAEAKKEILDTVQVPLEHPELFKLGLNRSGVLLYGPPGCGKTLLAKAVATECCLHFLSVKGPELLNMYVGQSEENVRVVFERARSASPCIVFFDELDALAPNRGKSGDSAGVMDRVVSQLLAELDGLESDKVVFVIGATNRPDLIDPALLRPGRFDRLVYLGPPQQHQDRIRVLQALTRKVLLCCDDRDAFFEAVIASLPHNGAGLTGADFYALTVDAMMAAVERHVSLESAAVVDSGSSQLVLTLEDFQVASERLVPSVSKKDMMYYTSVQNAMVQS